MDRPKIDHDNLRITGKHKAVKVPHVRVDDDVVVVVTQAFCGHGHDLVGITAAEFDGYPAVSLMLRGDGREGLVHLSPIHGDDRKDGLVDLPVGTPCELLCPVCMEPLDIVGDVEGETDAQYYALYLTPNKNTGSMVMISNVWGHYHSRIVDDFELISYWATQHEALEDD
jgi:hypothetical protein